MTDQRFHFVTDTATMCVFDLASLRHRLTDSADWWSIPGDEVDELEKGNAAFVNLGEDGQYEVTVLPDLPVFQIELRLRTP